MWLVVNCKNGVSSYEVHRAIGVTQKTAWFMLSRLRLVLQDRSTGGKLGGEVEVDETFIGGKARNMHKSKLRKLSLDAEQSHDRQGCRDGSIGAHDNGSARVACVWRSCAEHAPQSLAPAHRPARRGWHDGSYGLVAVLSPPERGR